MLSYYNTVVMCFLLHHREYLVLVRRRRVQLDLTGSCGHWAILSSLGDHLQMYVTNTQLWCGRTHTVVTERSFSITVNITCSGLYIVHWATYVDSMWLPDTSFIASQYVNYCLVAR